MSILDDINTKLSTDIDTKLSNDDSWSEIEWTSKNIDIISKAFRCNKYYDWMYNDGLQKIVTYKQIPEFRSQNINSIAFYYFYRHSRREHLRGSLGIIVYKCSLRLDNAILIGEPNYFHSYLYNVDNIMDLYIIVSNFIEKCKHKNYKSKDDFELFGYGSIR